MSVLGVDQGTTSTRAVLFDGDAAPRVIFSRAHRQHYPRPGWVEHDAEEILRDVAAAFAAAPPGVAAVGLANQGETCLGWDADTGAPVGPAIVWQDDRTAAEVARLRAAGAEAETLARAGLPLDPYFSASKLAWILRENPQARRLADRGRLRLGTTDAFLRDRLTGRFETDAATASRTSLMNLATLDWDEALLRLFGVPREALPPIGACAGDLGVVATGGGAAPLGASLVDQQAALYGHGARRPGEAKLTIGTGAFMLAVAGAEPPRADGGVLPTVAWVRQGQPAVYALDGGVYAAAAAVDWARRLGLFRDFAEIAAFDAPPAVSRGLIFVPALAGLACPHWDRGARGAWVGLSLDAGPLDLAQAVLEGVACRIAEVARAVAALAPLAEPIRLDGGLAANPYLRGVLAGLLGRGLALASDPEVTARGAAALAAEALGSAAPPAPPAEPVAPLATPADALDRFAAARRAAQALGPALSGA